MTEEDSVFAKCAWRLIPFMMLLFTVNFLDRVNVGFAALTMNKDLGFSPAVFGFGAGVFFIGYFACGVPSNVVLARIGARRWIFAIMALWGLVSAACALVQGPASFTILRFLLGVTEAGFFPGMIYYLTLWFPKAYRARFAAAFIASGPLANIIGGPLSGVILGMDGALALHGWQWLFLVEGLPACVLAFVVLRVMPDGPEQASWLSPREKDLVARHLTAEQTGKEMAFWPALRDSRVLALSLVLLGIQSGLFGISLWLPQIIQSMGFSTLETGFLVVPPYLVSIVAMILWGRSSDLKGERIWHVSIAASFAAAGLLAASVLHSALPLLVVLGIGVIGIQATLGPFWGLPTSFLGNTAAAGGIALVNAIGSLGGFFAPAIIGVLKQQTGGYGAGLMVMAAGLLTSAVIVLALGRALPSARAQYS
jgi:ACS family tartrate transporter-like MFS transporter